MFIRETIKSVKNRKYKQYKLIESIRTPLGPRQNVIFNFGNALDLGKDKWKQLANAIEQKLHGQSDLLSVEDKEIEALAQHYSQLIVKERLTRKQNEEATHKEEKINAAERPEYKPVNVKSLKSSAARTVGGEHVALSQMKDYKIDQLLKKLSFKEKEVSYAKMLIAGRMIHPAGERETARWVSRVSAIGELTGSQIKVYDNVLHRTAILLLKNKAALEKELISAARKQFCLQETVILYDLTNTYFEGQKKHSKIAKFGKSKERRNDRRLVTLALSIDEEGFPKWSRILEGNVGEASTLRGMLEKIDEDEIFRKTKTVVIDAGIATEENIGIIKAKGYGYIAVSRKKTADLWQNSATEREINLAYTAEKLKVKLIRKADENYCVCHSLEKEKRDKDIWLKKQEKFERGLIKIRAGLEKKNTSKKYEKIIERIGRLKERYRIGYYYDIEVKEKTGLVTNIEFKKNEQAQTNENGFGKYVLRTNRTDLNEEQISKIHRSLTRIEDSFRHLKSELGLRPIYHKKDQNSIAHIFITVLAYHLISAILKRLRNKGINYTWNTVRNILNTQVRVTTSFNVKDEGMVNIRDSTTPTTEQREIYNSLGIVHDPLQKVKA